MTDETRMTLIKALNRCLNENNQQLSDPVHEDIHDELLEDNKELLAALSEIRRKP